MDSLSFQSPLIRRSARVSARATPLPLQLPFKDAENGKDEAAHETRDSEASEPRIVEESSIVTPSGLISDQRGHQTPRGHVDLDIGDAATETTEDGIILHVATTSPSLRIEPRASRTRTPCTASSSGLRQSRATHVVVRSTKALTIPVTPVLKLTGRRGPKLYSCMGSEARSAETLAPPPRLQSTIPVAPQLMTELRARSAGRLRPQTREERVPLKAMLYTRPSSGGAAHGTRSSVAENTVSAVETFQPTVPVSPKFSSRSRAKSAPPKRTNPTNDLPTRPRGPRELTEPQEFRLESVRRSQQSRVLRDQQEERIRVAVAAARDGLPALPAPDFSRPFVPQPSVRPLTEFSVFQLQGEERHLEAAAAMRERARRAADQAVAATLAFRARLAPVSTYEAPGLTKPASEGRVSVQAVKSGLHLVSNDRASARREFDEGLRVRMQARQQAREQILDDVLQKENARVNELRQLPISEGGLKFVAMPVLLDDPFPAHYVPPRPLTEPESPHLLIDRRPRMNLRS